MFRTRDFRWALVCGLLLLLCGGALAESRIWTDKRGRQLRAEFVRLVGNDVVLERPNGQVARVPLASLSEADHQFLKTLLAAEGVRIWTSTDGRQIQAQYLRVRDGHVYVKIEGESTSFPFDKLSVADRLFVRQKAADDGQSDQLPEPADEETLPAARQWTDVDGQSAVGQFERILPDGRVLLAVEGVTRVLDVAQLSEDDQEHLREVLKPQGLAHLVPAPQPPPEPEPPEPPPTNPTTTNPPTDPHAPTNPQPPIATRPPVTHPPATSPTTPSSPRPDTRPWRSLDPQPKNNAQHANEARSAPASPSDGSRHPGTISPGAAMVMIVSGGLIHFAGVLWIMVIALQNGDTLWALGCFFCNLAAMIYGFASTDQCGAPLSMIFIGLGLNMTAMVLVVF